MSRRGPSICHKQYPGKRETPKGKEKKRSNSLALESIIKPKFFLVTEKLCTLRVGDPNQKQLSLQRKGIMLLTFWS